MYPLNPMIRFSIFGKEICPTTGRTHWQGYVELKKPQRLSFLKKAFQDDGLHCEKAKGSPQQNIEYCSKDGATIQTGESKKQGQRSDLEEAASDIVTGKRKLSDIMIEDPRTYCRYRNGLRDIAALQAQRSNKGFRELEVFVYWGEAGTGKTRKAVEENPEHYMLGKAPRVWFDGYDQESTLIIDEFYGWIPYGYLLRILDGYALRVEVKGGHTYAAWTKVVITSNKDPREWYEFGMTPALRRRITRIIHFENLN